MPLTPQQHEAVHRREVSVVLSSGAGCGKTHVLTQRYLSHLETDGAEVSQIVAITFTERAARHMRERIRSAIVEHLAGAESEEIAARWEQHLRALETAQISTIHAFCANLLRQHAVDAGIDPRFDVLEEFLAVNLENEALARCLQDLLTAETQPGQDLRQLILLFGWKATVEAVRQLLREREPVRQQQWLARAPEEVFQDWHDYAFRDLLPAYVQYLSSANVKIARCLWLLRNTPCSGPKMAANVQQVLAGIAELAANKKGLEENLNTIKEAAKVTGTEKAKAWESAEIYEEIKDALTEFRKELPERMKMFVEPASGGRQSPDESQNQGTDVPRSPIDAILVGQRFLRVADEVAQAYRQLKRRHGVVDFQDLLVQARDLLRDHAEVRERLQRRYQFLLIDELQDTDPVQMELVEYLTGAGLSAGKLFAVGDHSQSIYRFRGADVRMFQNLRRRMPLEGRLGLTLNFRSQPAILDFTNALLGPVPGMESHGNALEDYEPLQPHHAQVNPGPCIEFLWSPRTEEDNVTAARMIEAEWIARRIAQMIQEKERLVVARTDGTETLRAVQPGDVVLLFRAMTNVELYEAALRRHGLHYYLVGGRAFFAQQEIFDLLDLLRALENPQDALSLAGTLRSPFCCLSDEALFVLARHQDGMWAGLHDAQIYSRLPPGQQSQVERSAANLDRWRQRKNHLPIAGLLNEILADSGFDAALQFEFLGDRKLANLWKLIDIARSFDRSGLFGLAEFIERLDDLVRSQPREEQAATQPENANVVRLMSIHQAKGLEFPVVIIPDLAATVGGSRWAAARWDSRLGCVVRPPEDDPPPFSDFGWRLWQAGETVADWREDLRTLYVACTRAMDVLILSAALPEKFSPQSPWMLALAQRFDLNTAQLVQPGMCGKIPQIRVTDWRCEPPDIVLEEASRQTVPMPLPDFADIFLTHDGGGSHEPDAEFQWDAEDGSDRSHWPGEAG